MPVHDSSCPHRPTIRGKRILLLGANGDLLTLIAFMLRYDGHIVETVDDATRARSLCASRAIDVVIADLPLSDNNHQTLVAWLGEAPVIPVIVLAEPQAAGSAMQMVLRDEVTVHQKPIHPGRLRAHLAALRPVPRSGDGAGAAPRLTFERSRIRRKAAP